MTREEQILNKAIDYSEIEENFLEYDDCGDVCDDKTFVEKAFIEGAKWADEHPNKELKRLIRKAESYDKLVNKGLVNIERVCEWLYNNAEDYTIDGGLSIEALIYFFKKAMEE